MPQDPLFVTGTSDPFYEDLARKACTDAGLDPDALDFIVTGSDPVVDPDGSGEEPRIEERPLWENFAISVVQQYAPLKAKFDAIEARLDALENP